MTSPIIQIDSVDFSYAPDVERPVFALQDICLNVFPGEYVVILGHNGSGKSTLAKLLNALLLPTHGDLWVGGWNTQDPAHTLDIRSTVGMVFQSPDNQIVATVVEEDVAFGPANLGLPEAELRQRVDWALDLVDMQAFRRRAPHLLSAGQKQRVAIAGAMALKPRVLVLDESTAMLDPVGRQEVLSAIHGLNRAGTTIIAITHLMPEAVEASRILVLEAGRIAMDGSPHQVFSQADRLRELHLDVPQITDLAHALHRRDPRIPAGCLTVAEMEAALLPLMPGHPA